jgi:hypothetical protein
MFKGLGLSGHRLFKSKLGLVRFEFNDVGMNKDRSIELSPDFVDDFLGKMILNAGAFRKHHA